MKKIFKGFTLAEVLITLTIIGVIAAVTIPTLMRSYRKHQIETSLKYAYTILSNTLTMAQTEYGSLPEMVEACVSDDYNERTNCFTNKYLKPYLKYSNTCASNEGSCKAVFPTNRVKTLDGTAHDWERLTPNGRMTK